MGISGVVVSVSAYVHGILDIFQSHKSNSVVYVRMAVLFPMGTVVAVSVSAYVHGTLDIVPSH